MIKGRHLFCFLICLFSEYYVLSQTAGIRFRHLTIDDGLSQNSVNCIHRDRYGFMWFGTQDGLNRYDGYQFIRYRHERNNVNSISNNYIWDIHEDEEGILWLATFGGGLSSLNTVTGKVNNYKTVPGNSNSFPSNRLFSITEFPKGTLWIGSNEGLIRFDKSTSASEIYLTRRKSDNTLADNYVGVIAPDGNGNIWLRADSGLTKFNTKTLNAEYASQSNFLKHFKADHVTDIKNINGVLYITCESGLLEINLKQKTGRLLLTPREIKNTERTPVFQRVLPLENNRFVIGTNIGLILFEGNSNEHTVYHNDAADESSISHNNVLSLFQSGDGIIWIGTRNGLNKIETERPDFIHTRSIPGRNGLSNKNVNSFIEENDSTLWIGTPDGLNLYHKNNDTWSVFRKDERDKNSLASNYILCLFKDSGGSKWVGTRGGGFCKIGIKPGGQADIRRVQPYNDTAASVSVHYITEDKDGSLWIGTGGAGLWKYDPGNNSVKKYGTAKDGTGPAHPFIFSILQDNFGYLWIGTPTGGLNLFDPATEKFIYFRNNPENKNSISNDIVLSLHTDRKNNLWIGTSGGLNKLVLPLGPDIFRSLSNTNTDSLFKNFGHEHGFPNDVIYGMLEDDHEKLWITTNKGLVVFDTGKEKVIKTFDASDGLQSNEFNQNGFYKNSSGWFYFGGVDGFNMLHPDSVTGNKYIPPVVITSVSLFNEPLKAGIASAGGFILDKEVNTLDRINLSWKHDVITFEFAALNYINPQKNQYSYMLEGFNKDWVDAGNTRTATYTNLDPGNYVFKIRASNNSGLWNETGTTLKINISTPPWRSWYAYLLYGAVIAYVTWLFIRYRVQKATREIKIQAQIEKARSEEREEFRKSSAADFHDEAGNKITKITLFTEMARNEINNKTQLDDYLKKIQVNITELSSGMRDFLWVMDSRRDTLFETATRLKDFGESIFTENGKPFTVNGMNASLEKIILDMNTRRAVLQIFKEAMNNCAKHAMAKEVVLTISHSSGTMEISLNDNGKGFDKTEDLNENNYGLTIMHERAKKINAVLEINSKKDEGTVILLKCNMPHMSNS